MRIVKLKAQRTMPKGRAYNKPKLHHKDDPRLTLNDPKALR